MQIRFLTVAASLLFATLLPAQDHKADKAPAADAAMPMPKPGPEHEHLAKAAGTWDVAVEGAGMPSSKGTSEMKMSLNGFWLCETFLADMMGQKFEGHAVTGFDPLKGKYVSTWIDNMSPTMFVTEGMFDAKTRTLTMVGDGVDQAGKKVRMRNLTIHKDANTVIFEMYHTGADGKEAKVMTITYTRHGAAPAK